MGGWWVVTQPISRVGGEKQKVPILFFAGVSLVEVTSCPDGWVVDKTKIMLSQLKTKVGVEV